mgnify:CR=1 FL=1|tara:strand:+ start:35977 stop:36333 length:357 start_codon:yes stop_codon:yes gene_type:complete
MKIDCITFREAPVEEYINNPKNPIESVMTQIVMYAQKKLSKAMADPTTGLNQLHPIMVVNMVTTNLMINLMADFIRYTANTPAARITMMRDITKSLSDMINDGWGIIETANADTTEEH